MEYHRDVVGNIDRDNAGAAIPSIAVIDAPISTMNKKEDSLTSSQTKEIPDESFESSTAVIDEAIDRALQLIETVSNVENGVDSSMKAGSEALYVDETTPIMLGHQDDVTAEEGEQEQEISVDEAVAIWEGFGKEKDAKISHRPSLDDTDSPLESNTGEEPTTPKASGPMIRNREYSADTEVDEVAQEAAVKITIEDLTPNPVENSITLFKNVQVKKKKPTFQEHPKDLFEATLDAVGMDKILGVDEESLRKNNVFGHNQQSSIPQSHLRFRSYESTDALEWALDSLGVDKICGVDEETIGIQTSGVPTFKTRHPSLITPTSGSESDYEFPELLRGTKDIFANENLVREEKDTSTISTRHNISPDVFTNEFSREDHPQSLEHLLWDRLAGLCEPIHLELTEKSEEEQETFNEIIATTNSDVSGTFI